MKKENLRKICDTIGHNFGVLGTIKHEGDWQTAKKCDICGTVIILRYREWWEIRGEEPKETV